MEIFAHFIHEADNLGIRVRRRHLGGPVADIEDDEREQNEVERGVEEAEAKAKAAVQAFPKSEAKVAGLVFVKDVRFLMNRERSHFENDRDDDESDKRTEHPQEDGIFHAHEVKDGTDEFAERAAEQGANEDGNGGERDAYRALAEAKSGQRCQQNQSQEPNCHVL